MKTFLLISAFFIAIGVLMATAVFPGPASAQSQCAAFPEVSWWGKMSHERVTRYVNRRHNGDWNSYVKKWEGRLSSMRGLRAHNGSAVIKRNGVTLKGASLDAYIEKIEKRVRVTRCLAAANSIANFETAAGGEGGAGKKSGDVTNPPKEGIFGKPE